MSNESFTFPCIYKESVIVDIKECSECTNSNTCDLYASMLDESCDYMSNT